MFQGYKEEFDNISRSLANAGDSQKSCAIYRIGSVSKTQLALQFVYNSCSKFPYIFWLSAEDEANLSMTYADIAISLRLSRQNDSTQLRIDAAKRWLCES